MLKKLIFMMIAAMLVLPSVVLAKKVGDINLPDTLTEGSTSLSLNGAGIREKFFIDLYVGGLYLKAKSKSDSTVLNGKDTMAIRLHIVSSRITSKKMSSATLDGFKASTGGNTSAIQSQINQFMNVFKQKINVNDTYNFVYVSGTGTKVYKNNQLKATITGFAFKKALFGIWLGSDPADDDLKEKMLDMD
jgi:hypothetical protein